MKQEFKGFIIVSNDERFIVKPKHPPRLINLSRNPSFSIIKDASFSSDVSAMRRIDTINKRASIGTLSRPNWDGIYKTVAALNLRIKEITIII